MTFCNYIYFKQLISAIAGQTMRSEKDDKRRTKLFLAILGEKGKKK